MNKRDPARTFVLYNALFSGGLAVICTAYVPWLVRLGLSLAEIAVVNTVFLIGGSLLELPTGMLADGKSRAWSVRIGVLVVTLACFGYAFARGFWSAALCEAGCALGMAFVSGADQAWLTDALTRRGEQNRVGQVLGTSLSWNAAVSLVIGCLGAPLAAVWPAGPWVASGLILLVCLAVCVVRMDSSGEPMRRVSETEAFRQSWRIMRTRRTLAWTAIAAATFGLVQAFNLYWPIRYQLMTGQMGLTWVWAACYGSLVVAGWLVRRQRGGFGLETHGIAAALLLAGLGLAGAGLVPAALGSIGFAMVHELGRGAFNPLLGGLTQRHVESECRATYGSMQSLVGKAGFGLVVIALAVAFSDTTPSAEAVSAAWIVAGATLALGAVVLWLARPRTVTATDETQPIVP
jgi:DHA3 family tetracycline resistance protein-like MFS transporter